jgi:hypothetical protein
MFESLPENDEQHDYFTIVTLIDITKTNGTYQYPQGFENTRSYVNLIRNQRRNLNSFMQVIALRAQPIYITDPKQYYDQALTKFGFGSNYETATIWSFNFGVEHKGIYELNHRPFGGLLDDLHNVPIITGLLETVHIDLTVIDTHNSKTKNTIILQ